MKRRGFITLLGGAAAWSLAARAQQGEQIRRIGVLTGDAEDDPGVKARLAAFQQGLDRLGWSADRNVRIDYRFAANTSLAIELAPSPVESAADIERAIESLAREPNGGLVVLPGTPIEHRDLVIALTARHRLPAVYPFRFFVAAGGLMSYGTDFIDQSRQAAGYVDRILRGANAADLPVQAPTKYETVLNLRTAKALGLDVPSSLLVRADEVIE